MIARKLNGKAFPGKPKDRGHGAGGRVRQRRSLPASPAHERKRHPSQSDGDSLNEYRRSRLRRRIRTAQGAEARPRALSCPDGSNRTGKLKEHVLNVANWTGHASGACDRP